MVDFKVGGVSGSSGPKRTRKTKRGGDSDSNFADALKEATGSQQTSEAGGVQGVASVNSVLALQEVETSTEGRSRGLLIGYGDNLLDRLDDLRHELLLGAVSKEKLADLAHEMRQKRQHIDDPHLNDLINEIELRAEVEIAKLTRER